MSKKDYSSWNKGDLIKEIQKLEKRKTYGITWEQKLEDVVEKCKNELPVLEEVKGKEIETGKGGPTNIFIEGDNYHALSVMNYTHKGKISVIYIDPPYNTGNKEFVYNDRIVDLEDAYRHSKWLSFMEKRLKLTRVLLQNKGIMFISIDDNEVAQLSLLCKGLFGADNVEIMIWEKITSNAGKFKIVKRFRTDHEYIIVVYKNKNETTFRKIEELPEIEGTPINPDNDPRGDWISGNFSTTEEKSDKEGENYYTVKSPAGKEFSREWKYDKEEFERLNKDKRIFWGENGKNVPRLKVFVNEPKPVYISSIIRKKGTAKSAAEDLERILGKRLFEHPKPTALIEYLLKFIDNKDAHVLDFFAGSGTTAEAVLHLNQMDGGNREFILCTDNQSNNGSGFKIAEDICYPRVKKVLEGYENSDGAKIKGTGGNLKYFRTEFVGAAPTDKNKIKLTKKATEMLCLKEGTFEKVLDKREFKIFKNAKAFTGIVFNHSYIQEFKDTIKKMDGVFSVYVFSLGGDTFDEEFEDLDGKVKLTPIPESILNTYRKIFR